MLYSSLEEVIFAVNKRVGRVVESRIAEAVGRVVED